MGVVRRPRVAPSHWLALKTLTRGVFGTLFSFGVKGGDPSVSSRVVNSLKLTSNVANVGDGRTPVIHPAGTTHQQLTEDEQYASGVSPDLLRVRLSVLYIVELLTRCLVQVSFGFEHINDINADFEEALKVVLSA